MSDLMTAGNPTAPVPRLVEHLFRHEAGQIIATLTRLLGPGRLDLAEDVAQETLIKALRQWSQSGVPENPGAWLMTVAKNYALDILRRESRARQKAPLLAREWEAQHMAEMPTPEMLDSALHDDMLRMIFTCCHPALSREAQVALTLKTLGGFGVGEIARAFLAPEPTIAQRLVRAKRTLRLAAVSFAVPDTAEMPARLGAVLDVLYLLFNEGYSAHAGEDLVRHDLCAEAVRLAALVAAHPAGDRPEVHALLALMHLQAARLPARTDAGGDLLLLDAQDRALWDRAGIARGLATLARASAGDRVTPYHLQAGIAACHAVAPTWDATDWRRILALYDDLLALAPSPVVALNRAVAVRMVHGPFAGLASLDGVRTQPGMETYPLYHATLAAFRRDAGDNAGAIASYNDALRFVGTEPERRFLLHRVASLDTLHASASQ